MRVLLILASVLSLVIHETVPAHVIHHTNDIQVDIVTDTGRVLPVYRQSSSEINTFRAYLEAVYGKNYGINIHNRTGNRIGLVIAVDGRNIISGQKSQLKASEQMYILGPHEYGNFEGWRTSTRKIHRFYFTDEGDSYAGAWDDYTAMGVIAVAVFPEKKYDRPLHYDQSESRRKIGRPGAVPQSPSAGANEKSARADADLESQPGTGFGNQKYSRVRVVKFDPVRIPSSRYFLKYEWRETLCDKGIIHCGINRPSNRFWPDEGGFTPYPPG